MSLSPANIPSSVKQAIKANAARLSFACMVHQCLSDIDELGKRDPAMKKLDKIVSWQDHGRAFRIHDRKKFEEVIMPVWFVRLKYNSFLRQLSLFGFRKIYRETQYVQKGAWYHDLFVQGKPELAHGIQKIGKAKPAAAQAAAPAAVKLYSNNFNVFGISCPGSMNSNNSCGSSFGNKTNMESAMSQSTLSYLQLKNFIRLNQGQETTTPLEQQPSSSQTITGSLIGMLSNSQPAWSMLPPAPAPALETTEATPEDNPILDLVLKNFDMAFSETEKTTNATPCCDKGDSCLEHIEPTPIRPGGFQDGMAFRETDKATNSTPCCDKGDSCLEHIEPTPIRPGGFQDSIHQASKTLQAQLYEVMYPTDSAF